jgi:hypothetical protein
MESTSAAGTTTPAPSPIEPVSPYLASPVRTLRDACRESGRDDGGRLCPDCCVKDLCEAELVRAERRNRGPR